MGENSLVRPFRLDHETGSETAVNLSRRAEMLRFIDPTMLHAHAVCNGNGIFPLGPRFIGSTKDHVRMTEADVTRALGAFPGRLPWALVARQAAAQHFVFKKEILLLGR